MSAGTVDFRIDYNEREAWLRLIGTDSTIHLFAMADFDTTDELTDVLREVVGLTPEQADHVVTALDVKVGGAA